MVYLIHIEPAYKHARHYLGCVNLVDKRFEHHCDGTGARLTQVAVSAGCTLSIVRKWEGSKDLERKLKHQKNSPRLCPTCTPNALNHGKL